MLVIGGRGFEDLHIMRGWMKLGMRVRK